MCSPCVISIVLKRFYSCKLQLDFIVSIVKSQPTHFIARRTYTFAFFNITNKILTQILLDQFDECIDSSGERCLGGQRCGKGITFSVCVGRKHNRLVDGNILWDSKTIWVI